MANTKPKHLKPAWKPGQSGNPKGRPPKAKCIPDILRRITAEEIDTKHGKIPMLDAILRVVAERALRGQQWAVVFMAERMEGKPVSTVNVEGGSEMGRGLVEAVAAVLNATEGEKGNGKPESARPERSTSRHPSF